MSSSNNKVSGRSIAFALNRPRVWLPVLAGVGLIATGVSTVAGLILIAIGVVKVRGILSHDDLDQRLQLKQEKKRHRIYRRLTQAEQREILALDEYCIKLRESGGEPELCSEVMDQAWDIVHAASGEDATSQLVRLRQSLPLLDASAPVGPNSRPYCLVHKVGRVDSFLHVTLGLALD